MSGRYGNCDQLHSALFTRDHVQLSRLLYKRVLAEVVEFDMIPIETAKWNCVALPHGAKY
jgi:hypothetical protein